MTGKKTASLARALDAAAELIATSDGVDPSIADIVAKSQCSTATIYDAYENKRGFFGKLVEHCQRYEKAPELRRTNDPDNALPCILDYLADYIGFLSAPRTRRMLKFSVKSWAESPYSLEVFRERDQLCNLASLIEMGIEAGDFCSIDAKVSAYGIICASNFEPIIAALYFPWEVDIRALVRTAVLIHLTPKGRDRLVAWDDARWAPSPRQRSYGEIGSLSFAAHSPID